MLASNKDDNDKFIFPVHCINHFFSPTRKERIENMSIEVQIPNHNSSCTESTVNIVQNGEELESIDITNDTVVFLNKETHTEFNQNEAEHANHEVCMDNYEQKENSAADDDTNQESIKESLMTTEPSSVDIKGTDVTHIIDTNHKNEEISTPCDSEVLNDKIQTIVVKLDEKMEDLSRKIIHMSVSIDHIKQKTEQQKKYNESRVKRHVSVRFHAEIDPTKNQFAESELRKEISQDMFAKVSNNANQFLNSVTSTQLVTAVLRDERLKRWMDILYSHVNVCIN